MLVYGDVEWVETVGDRVRKIERRLDDMEALPRGDERHAALVAAFIGTSELVQGLVDADFENRGFDADSSLHGGGMECLSLLARGIVESWQSGRLRTFCPGGFRDRLRAFPREPSIRIRQAEGYAFYALYPESYVEAAIRSGLGPNTRVIGIRSIGTGLAALVAAALNAPPAFTVRPVGHPFGREIQVDAAVTARLTEEPDTPFAIVDEGPGLSGSSFGAVADWLEAAGISRDRIHFFPSHPGPLGPQASPERRERWSGAARHFVGMDDLLLESAGSPLVHWVESLVGPLLGELEDISGGAWRSLRYPERRLWPAANIQQERRKFLARTKDATWLVKFAGLDESGMRKQALAERLHQAGFAPEVAGYRHGFLVERWHGDAMSLDRHPIDRGKLLNRIGSYLAFRARHCAARSDQGASLAALREMARHNTGQALGERGTAVLDRILPSPETFQDRIRRVMTDNRMQPWEWLASGDRLIKVDALDHCAAHDLVGCQDIVWDIAGAAAEFSLSPRETEDLCALVREESGHPVSHAALAFMLPCYLAFQLGAHRMAAGALKGSEEEERLRIAAERYGHLLQSCLHHQGRLGIDEEQDRVPAGYRPRHS